jgi:hypothetical protein
VPAFRTPRTIAAISSLYLYRLPVTEWVGFEVVSHHARDGIAIDECWLYDEEGAIGTSTVAALAQRRPMTNPASRDMIARKN